MTPTFGRPLRPASRRRPLRHPDQLGLALPLTAQERRAALVVLPGGASTTPTPITAAVAVTQRRRAA